MSCLLTICLDSILTCFDQRITNACTESANNLLRARILLNRHGAHRMKPFRQVNKNHHVAEEEMIYGLPSTEIEPDEISPGMDTSTLLDLIEKGEV